MSTPTTSGLSPVPFAPLAIDELRYRRDSAQTLAGVRCMVVVEDGGVFKPHDLEWLRERGAEALTYWLALEARQVVA